MSDDATQVIEALDLMAKEGRQGTAAGAKAALRRALSAARAEGFEKAREMAAVIAGAMAHNCGVAAAGMRTEPNQRAWLKAQEMSADVERTIRAMQDGAVDEGRISIDAPDTIDDVVAFVDTGAPKP